MKIRYLNGEKVCVVQDDLNKCVSIYNYKKVVQTLNTIFRQAEVSAEGSCDDAMNVVLIMISGAGKFEERRISIREREVVFDDEIKVKKEWEPRLQLPRCNKSSTEYRGLKIIKGGMASI